MTLRRIGSILIVLMGLNAFVGSFFTFERGNFTLRLVPYAFKFFQLFLMLTIIIYFLVQRTIRIKTDHLFWIIFLLIGDMGISIFYASDPVNPTDFARVLFWVFAAFAIYFLRQADCLDEKILYQMVLFNLFWVCLRILAYKLFNIWIGVDTGNFGDTRDGVVGSLSYTLVWFVPLFLLFESKIKFPVLLTVLFAMLAPFKRGALLGLILGSLVYYFLNRRVPGRNKGSLARDAIQVLALLILGGVGFLVFKEHILDRLSDIGGDKSLGSGRGIFYQIVLNHWENFMGIKKLIGAGFFAVMPMLGTYYEQAIPAHSDWLETLYDQGIIGVSILTLFHLLFIARVLGVIRKRAEFGPHLAYSYTIFFLASVYSVTLYNFETSWFGVSMGYYLGTEALMKRKKARETVPTLAGKVSALSPVQVRPYGGIS